MSEWTGDVQARLDAGEALTIWPSAHIKARSFATGQIEAVGFTQGSEILSIAVEGEARTYVPAGDALVIDGLEIRAGLTIQGQRVTVRGINETVDDLQRVFDLQLAPFDVHDLAFTAGMKFLGSRRKFNGFVDGGSVSKDDRAGQVSLVAVSALRKGTRKLDAMLNTDRDQAFKYASIVEGDAWG